MAKEPDWRDKQFASDNYAGICPEAWEAMQRANHHHVPGYGDDEWTEKVSDQLREIFQTQCEVFFTFNGTAANSLALAAMCQSYHSVVCHEAAHIETDECGAPAFFSNGVKLLTVKGDLAKVTPDTIEAVTHKRSDIHYPKPKVVSVTQSTELGTVYTQSELAAIGATVHGLGLKLHMDGARFANALVSIGCSPAEITWKVGVDVLCLGGTKNGLAVGEAMIFFNKELAEEFAYRCKQSGQLASKMRFLSAPWLGLLENDVWLNNARHANAMAQRLWSGIEKVMIDYPNLTAEKSMKVAYPIHANAVFVHLPDQITEAMHQRGWKFYNFIGGASRLMCSWDTQPEDVDAFVTDLAESISAC